MTILVMAVVRITRAEEAARISAFPFRAKEYKSRLTLCVGRLLGFKLYRVYFFASAGAGAAAGAATAALGSSFFGAGFSSLKRGFR